MSLSTLALGVRDHLRVNLVNFYGDGATDPSPQQRASNLRVMTNSMLVAPNCGHEFIAVCGDQTRSKSQRLQLGIEESFGIRIAVTLRINDIPPDYRGELGYVDDNAKFALSWVSVEARCREIVGLLDKNYDLLAAINSNLGTGGEFTEPLAWAGTDAEPEEVGADHFYSFGDQRPGTDQVYGLLMNCYFDGAIRLQSNTIYDKASL